MDVAWLALVVLDCHVKVAVDYVDLFVHLPSWVLFSRRRLCAWHYENSVVWQDLTGVHANCCRVVWFLTIVQLPPIGYTFHYTVVSKIVQMVSVDVRLAIYMRYGRVQSCTRLCRWCQFMYDYWWCWYDILWWNTLLWLKLLLIYDYWWCRYDILRWNTLLWLKLLLIYSRLSGQAFGYATWMCTVWL